MLAFFQSVSEWPLALAIKNSGATFSFLEGLHLVGVALFFGPLLLLDMRLLGLSLGLPLSATSRHLLPAVWSGFVLITVSGLLLFVTNAHLYAVSRSFQLKLVFMVVGGANMLLFEGLIRGRAAGWDRFSPTPAVAKLSALLSISLWVSTIVAGRWMAYEKNWAVQFFL